MLRILKFVGAFLGTFLIIFLIVFGFNMNALITLFENSEDIQEGQQWVEKTYSLKGLTEYISAQPEHVSIASISIQNPDSSILYMEHTPRTMGRLSNVFMIIEYARQVEDKDLSPEEKVPLSDVEKYLLPYMDASNHENAMEHLRGRDKVSEKQEVSLDDLVRVAIEFNDPAVSDYLFFKVGQPNIEKLMDKLALEDTELPLPFSGLYIVLNPSIHENDFRKWMDSLSTMQRPSFDSLVIETSKKFKSEESFRSRVIKRFEEDEGMGVQFTELRDMLAFFPKTTASEMASLMRKLQQEKLVSKKVSKRIKDLMSWPMESTRIKNDFKTYGALYDSRMGLVNGIDYGLSAYSEEPFAQAVFFDELEVALWFHMSSNLIHQDFEQRLIWDPALRQATVQEINKTNNTQAMDTQNR